MPVRFGHVNRPIVRQVIKFEQDKPLFIVAGSDRSFDRETEMHWLSAQKRTVPCTHEDCPWCPLPWRVIVYVPVICFRWGDQSWQEKVLPVADGMKDFLKMAREKTVYRFERVRYFNAPVKFRFCAEHKYSSPFSGFDVEESLWKIWGMYKNAKKTADRPVADRSRLFDEELLGEAG